MCPTFLLLLPLQVVKSADVIFIAVKPHYVSVVLREVRGCFPLLHSWAMYSELYTVFPLSLVLRRCAAGCPGCTTAQHMPAAAGRAAGFALLLSLPAAIAAGTTKSRWGQQLSQTCIPQSFTCHPLPPTPSPAARAALPR